ncbi:MAG: hypothetical protein AB9900_11000 [Humidesulfovibrio sp.]
MREAMRAGGVGGSWPKHAGIGRLHEEKVTKKTMQRRERHKDRPKPPKQHTGLFGDLFMAIAYRRDPSNMRVQIGFMHKGTVQLAEKLQSGFETPVTAKMRILYSIRGFKMPKKKTIVTPARPLVGPVFQLTRHTYEPFIEARVLKYLNNARTFAKVA